MTLKFALPVPLSLTLSVGILLSPLVAEANNNKQTKGSPQATGESPSETIDALVEKGYREHKVEPNAPIDDATFVRRIYLDIVGRIPTIEEAEAFHGSSYDRKRERLIEDLLQSDGYVSHQYNFWADVLRVSRGLSKGATAAEAGYQLWIKEALAKNMPYDQFVYEMVAAKGYLWENGAIGYYQRDRGMPLDNMSNTVRTFLGTRLECAQCHDHPFDKWTQMDYFKMAAFSYGMDANRYDAPNRDALSRYQSEERNRRYNEAVGVEGFPVMRDESQIARYTTDPARYKKYLERYGVTDREFRQLAKKGIAAYKSFDEEYQEMRLAVNELYRQVRYFTVEERPRTLQLPHDYQYSDAKPKDPVAAATMFGAEIDLENIDEDAIDAYAQWMVSKDNPTFSRVIANRLWKRVFGMGVFEPLDEITDQTQITNPELMDFLEQLMKDLNYDMKAYMAVLYNTKTYQRAADANELVLGAPYYFPGPVLRRMTAEQIWDSITALALPEADSYRPRLKSQMTQVERVRQMYNSLEGRTPEEYIAMVKELGAALSDNIPKQTEVRARVYEAREKEDMELYNKLRKDLSDLQREGRELVSDIGFRHIGEKVDADELLAAVGMSEMAMGAMGGMAGGADSGAVLTKLPKPEMPKVPEDLDKNERRRWLAEQKADYSYYTKLIAGMARASELESPAPRGHFLREFGQSDREVIENAANNASVPQALNLLNGTISEALTNRFAVFGSRLHSAGDAEEKTQMIFQAMLSRQPNEREMELAAAEIETYGDDAFESMVWALLNTQQFLFVQ